MQWIYNGINNNDICDSVNAHWLANFLVCVRTLHENVKFWTFHQDGPRSLKNDQFEESTEIYPHFSPGYQRTCTGDSGGGHWMKEGGDGIRQIIIGVVTRGSPLCGEATYMEKINNKETISWIKGHLYP